ncbi:MAP7 domain-containing protein 1-like [Marmota monax]|uniref:MAP7 domain-containing protein 1-like n=1 Tax=Marmota monax TaxID=9995 RepID=UPI0026EFF389|nr:MAP7 domain-containing protein 1-like [Marmota monax]
MTSLNPGTSLLRRALFPNFEAALRKKEGLLYTRLPILTHTDEETEARRSEALDLAAFSNNSFTKCLSGRVRFVGCSAVAVRCPGIPGASRRCSRALARGRRLPARQAPEAAGPARPAPRPAPRPRLLPPPPPPRPLVGRQRGRSRGRGRASLKPFEGVGRPRGGRKGRELLLRGWAILALGDPPEPKVSTQPLGGGCSAGRPGQSCTPSSPRGDSVPTACCTECRWRPRGGGEERRRGSFGADSDAEWEETALGSSNPVTGGVLTSVVSESWLASQAVRAAEPAADRIAQKWRHRRRTTNRSLVCVCTCLGGKQEKVQKNKKKKRSRHLPVHESWHNLNERTIQRMMWTWKCW